VNKGDDTDGVSGMLRENEKQIQNFGLKTSWKETRLDVFMYYTEDGGSLFQ
jgi:hypothetical protein